MELKKISEKGFSPHPLLKVALLAALLLSIVMTLTSNYDKHPDEKHHFLAAVYYKQAFLPPVIGDPAVRDTYSFYGVSYLNYHWTEYFLAGKTAYILSFFTSNEVVQVRFFNVFLFLSLIGFFLYKSRDKAENLIFVCFLLISPQIWYLFSYINNDAFALFISILTIYQIGYEESFFNKFLEKPAVPENIAGGIFFGILTGLLLIVKTNYLPFIIFVFLWLFYTRPFFSFSRPFFNYQKLKKYAVVIFMAASVVSLRVAMDFYVNGETNFVGLAYLNYFNGNFEKKKNKLLRYQEEVAEYPYKPSTLENDLPNSDPPMKLKAKGYPFSDIFTRWKWHEVSFRSSFGTYGYMNINASNRFHFLFIILLVAFLSLLIYPILKNGQADSRIEFLIFIGSASLTIFASAYLSWIYAIQGQGRYFFPIIGMLALFVYKNRKNVYGNLINILIAAMFFLSAYSFVFAGLRRINE